MLRASQHLNLFFNALVFLTRFPAPRSVRFSSRLLCLSAVYFPWVGLCVGLVGVTIFQLSQIFVSPSIALLLTMVACIYFTGAFHEDGWADTCDALGGGYSPEHVKLIMKDSRLGTYGVIGLIGILAARYLALFQLINVPVVFSVVFIFGHTFSRWLALSVMWQLPYVQDNEVSKSRPLATAISTKSLLLSFMSVAFSGCILTLVLTQSPNVNSGLIALPILIAVLARAYLALLLKRAIGGFTGDGLGAVQQLSEVCFYISLAAIVN